ncbi:AN1-type zinc finger protein 2A [Blyttiomyces sp. JEL0837]|nr:AN1-type zinc finger protein 2A [Blyttiomyces sp. JEL0837]
MEWGTHCSEKTCNNLDFLPLTCLHCKLQFCNDHFKIDQHSCTVAKTIQLDAVATKCPICEKVVPVRRGDDPNGTVMDHIERGCPDPGTSTVPKMKVLRCGFGPCKNKESTLIKCKSCEKSFCIQHRHELDHKCERSARSRSQSTTPNPSNNSNRTPNNGSNNASVVDTSSDAELARALQMSLDEEERRRRRQGSNQRQNGGGSGGQDGGKSDCTIQ